MTNNIQGVLCWAGNPGIPGPASITDFELISMRWNEKYAQLQNLCFPILRFLRENPEIAGKVIITVDYIKSFI